MRGRLVKEWKNPLRATVVALVEVELDDHLAAGLQGDPGKVVQSQLLEATAGIRYRLRPRPCLRAGTHAYRGRRS